MSRMHVQVTAIPAALGMECRRQSMLGTEAFVIPRQPYLRRIRRLGCWANVGDAQQQAPLARLDRAGQVGRGGIGRRDREAMLASATPSTKAVLPGEARGPEQAEV